MIEQFETFIAPLKERLEKRGLYDSRVFVVIGLAIIGLTVFWNGAKIVQKNYELSLKVAELEQENAIIELENRNKELQNEYLKTDEFAEITARRVFGKAAAGEKVYIVPDDVALGSLETPQDEEMEKIERQETSTYRKNLEAWLAIYFGNN